MSNSLFMDESNGNGVYASKPNNAATQAATPATTTTTTSTASATASVTATNANNINSIMAAAAMSSGGSLPTSMSNEDLSQSLSEYTDADESISAPTEFLAEFLSAVMLKDYKKALKYCKLILQYEPNNVTAKDFYPLILDKLRGNAHTSSDSDENYNKSSSPELAQELQSSDPSAGESDGVVSFDEQQALSGGGEEENFSGGPHSQESSMSADSADDVSLSDSDNSEDIDEDDDDGEEGEEEEEEDALSSSGDDLPIDAPHRLAAAASHSSSGGEGEGRSRSDNTSHSYSSLLLEEEEADDIGPVVHLQYPKDATANDLDVSNGNKVPSASCSDSESPTEPLTQRLAAILRSKCGASNDNGINY